jgi:hypothetical protein
MSSLEGRVRAGRQVWLVGAALLLGASVAIALHPGQAGAVTTYTRAWSCQGRDFMPLEDGQTFGSFATARKGNGYFQCEADLPHKAVVTRVRFTLHDAWDGAEVRECRLARTSLAASTAGANSILAVVPTTGDPQDPGIVRRSTTSIAHATIDRLNYAYYLSCYISAEFDNLGIYGADVTYSITVANG